MTLSTTEMVIRLAVAVILGGLIGLNRKRKDKPAGLRTMALVSLGSATFTIIGIESVIQLVSVQNDPSGVVSMVRLDTSRIIAGIVGGIGFLGAGAIIQSRGRIQGMTTASGIWVTATIGVSVGLGLYVLALATTFLAFIVLAFQHRLFKSEEETDET
ncbi:MAG TPA: MgtC/SapB family protein [Phycisphaerales bacterium]|nr:MgtC/SapB family protein [Phycisphaerales bacterium]